MMDNLSREHDVARKKMRSLLLRSKAPNAKEMQDHYYKTIALIEHEARRTALIAVSEAPAEIERLRGAFNPRLWNDAQMKAWHQNIPDTQAAFEALLAASDNCEGLNSSGFEKEESE